MEHIGFFDFLHHFAIRSTVKRDLSWRNSMKMFSRVQNFLSALRTLLAGLLAHLLVRGRKSQDAEYCHVCQALGKPLQLGRFMIRPGARKGVQVLDPLPDIEIFVCNRHHPDCHLDGALWAEETQELLKKLDLATLCVYVHHHHRQ
jgi:hypothetical protein